jgi:NAD(P)-dependent dehydrogenase (short-subunit alcohol dehydrogenase family)
MFNLTGRTALVTGAGRSVGRGIAEALAAAGAAVAVNDLHSERAAEVVDSIVAAGGRATAAPFDVTSEAAVAAAVALVEATLGPVDILVNNAGISESAGGTSMFAESTPEDWRPTIELNLYGSMTMIRAVLPGMIDRRFGRIIQISSGASSRGLPIGVSAYGAAKAGAESLIRHIAVENGHHGVTANALALGLMNNNVDPSAFAAMPAMLAAVPVGRLGTPEEIGAASVWLSSDLGGFCTGQVIHVNGGTVFGR